MASWKVPNDFVVEKYRYNTEENDPLESDDSSLSDFVEEDGENSQDSRLSKHSDVGNSDLEMASTDTMQRLSDDESDDEAPRRRKNRVGDRISSDEEPVEEDDGPILLTSRKRSRDRRDSSQSIDAQESSGCGTSSAARSLSMGLGSGLYSTPKRYQQTNHDTSAAPKKAKRNLFRDNVDSGDEASNNSRRSTRVAEYREKVETAKDQMFRPLRELRKLRKEFLAKARISFVEQPPEDEPEVTVEANMVDSHSFVQDDDVVRIGTLNLLPNGERVNVRGKIIWAGDIETYPRADGSGDTSLRRILLRDDTGEVKITLWRSPRNFADGELIQCGMTLKFESLKKGTYNGKEELQTAFDTKIIHGEPMDGIPVQFDRAIVPVEALADTDDGCVVTVQGKVVQYGDDDSRPVRHGSEKRVPIRQIVLQDGTGFVNVTLWKHYSTSDLVRLDAFLTMYDLRKSTYNGQPTVSTNYGTMIKEYDAPLGIDANWSPFTSKEFTCQIEACDDHWTFVYNACGKCKLKKVEPKADQPGIVSCSSCNTDFAFRDTHVGIAMRVMVEGRKDLATIFTESVRKLPLSIPQTWGDVDVGELKATIVDEAQNALPIWARCIETSTGTLQIRKLL